MDEYLSPWYKVIDPSENGIFEIRFYVDPSELGPGFTFDDSDGNDWICIDLNPDDHIIYAEPMIDYMTKLIDKYDENSDDIIYGYVEMI